VLPFLNAWFATPGASSATPRQPAPARTEDQGDALYRARERRPELHRRAGAALEALIDAHVDHVIELYPAKHGWVPSDTPVHDAAAAARHDSTLLALLDKTLR
jgi:hypothetical protein